MTIKKPKGSFDYLLIMDCETSGLAFNTDDPSIDPITNKTYQSISWGMIVVNVHTLKVLDTLYLEIKWDGKSAWTKEAQSVHGLTIDYLEENGLTPEEAVIKIASLVLQYWGPDNPVCVAGHNVGSFDLWFLKRLLRDHDINIKFGSRVVDTNSIGIAAYRAFNSDDLFTATGSPVRDSHNHNALTDAYAVLNVLRDARTLKQISKDT